MWGEKPLREGEEGRERERMGWDERARGEDAVPVLHQKLMPTASV